VHEQASWPNNPPLVWRPFQLGFLLQCLSGLADPASPDREICDLLWFPTGGGKTEAYLGLTAFTLALRRLRHKGYDGVGVISRYTLRLLSIQQFRRALKLITACELLRVQPVNGLHGWRPDGTLPDRDWLWGEHRFSAGLWLGSAVTPNRLDSLPYPVNIPGAFETLRTGRGQNDPAQVTECPVCNTVLAFPEQSEGGQDKEWTLQLRLSRCEQQPAMETLCTEYIEVLSISLQPLNDQVSHLTLTLRANSGTLGSAAVDDWWAFKASLFGPQCPGYRDLLPQPRLRDRGLPLV
jgi:hypothetical protein